MANVGIATENIFLDWLTLPVLTEADTILDIATGTPAVEIVRSSEYMLYAMLKSVIAELSKMLYSGSLYIPPIILTIATVAAKIAAPWRKFCLFADNTVPSFLFSRSPARAFKTSIFKPCL